MADMDPQLSMIAQTPADLVDNTSSAAITFARAVELAAAGKTPDAYPLFVSVVTEDPKHVGAWYYMGTILYSDKKFAAARAAMEIANRLRPNEVHILTNLAWYCHVNEDSEAGLAHMKRAVELGPELALGWTNMSQIQIGLNDLDGALRSAQRGLDLATDGNPIHAMSLAFCYLFKGELQKGLHYYDARFRYKLQQFLSYAYPIWKGEKVGTLFLRAEQGIGDTITTLRFLPEAARRADKVLCYVNLELRAVVESMNLPNVEVFPLPSVLPASADAWLPMMSLPVAVGATTDDVMTKYAAPYLPAYPKPDKNTVFKVGLVWAGGGDMDMDRWRSMRLIDFVPLMSLPGVRCYSLQVGPPKQQIVDEGLHGLVTDLGPRLTDMRETSKVIGELDLVVSVDTSTAHLSAAMAHPTFVLRNRRSSDWRWGLGSRDESNPPPWYTKNARVFERDYGEQWSDVIQQVKEAIVSAQD